MDTLLTKVIFILELVLLLVHEMDAIHKKEWKMFIILKDMKDTSAYHLFMGLHIPLYFITFFLLFSDLQSIGIYLIDIFLIIHLLLHLCFYKHKANQFKGIFSNGLIYGASVLAILHIILISI